MECLTVTNFSAAAVFYQLPSLSCFSYLSCSFSSPPTLPFPFSISLFIIALSPSSSCRYLTSCVKSKYYITKWVEDVNKNTEGPYIRYTNIRLHYICPYSQFPSSLVRFPDQILFFRDEKWVWGFEEHLLAEKTWILSKSNINFSVIVYFWSNHLLFHYSKTSTDTLDIELQCHIKVFKFMNISTVTRINSISRYTVL